MNRSAKGFRVAGGILILLNLAVIFQTLTVRTQENYATLNLSQLDYVRYMLKGCLPQEKEMSGSLPISAAQVAWIVLFIILPLLLALITGIWGIVGNYRQKVSSILIFVILAIYIIMAASIGVLWPEAVYGQVYSRGSACVIHLVITGCASLLAAAALLCTPKKINTAQNAIPQVREIKQQQVEAKYNVIMEEARKEQPKPYVPGNPRGVMVGLNGLYAGAEIPFTNGEYIKLGRLPDNHLIFEGQPNVSRRHCKIKWDSVRKKYIFCDYSSNGSFINGSKDCLPQNLEMEMEPGTVVAIGDENNTFRLE